MPTPVVEPIDLAQETLRISEVFLSVQGESSRVGLPTVFVRLTGCPLRCVWCDTAYAFDGGDRRTIRDVVDGVAGYGVTHVTVTGGEPLAQPGCHALLRHLCDRGFAVSLETSGAMPIDDIDERVKIVMDIKAPDSGEVGRNRFENVPALKASDEVKFVLQGRADFEWACGVVSLYRLDERCEVLFSPVHDVLSPRLLAEWILAGKIPARLQVQLHKYLWGNERGR